MLVLYKHQRNRHAAFYSHGVQVELISRVNLRGLRRAVSAALLAALAMLIFAARPKAAEAVCGSKNAPAGAYALAPGTSTTLALGGDTKGMMDIAINLTGCRLPTNGVVDWYRHALIRGDRAISRSSFSTTVAITEPHRVDVYMTVTRTDLAAGKYVGTFDLDPQATYAPTLSVPVTVTVRDNRWLLVLLLSWIPAIAFGAFIVWARLRVSDGTQQSFWAWAVSLSTILGSVSGVGALWLVLQKNYLNDATWGTSFLPQIVQLAIIGGSAFIAALTAIGAGAKKVNQVATNRARRT